MTGSGTSQSCSLTSTAFPWSFLLPAGKTQKKITPLHAVSLITIAQKLRQRAQPPGNWNAESYLFSYPEAHRYGPSILCQSIFNYGNTARQKGPASVEFGKSAGPPALTGNPASTSYRGGRCAGADFYCQKTNGKGWKLLFWLSATGSLLLSEEKVAGAGSAGAPALPCLGRAVLALRFWVVSSGQDL